MVSFKKKKTYTSSAENRISFLPLFQILGELHPTKRQIVIGSLDKPTCSALFKSVESVLQEGQKQRSKIPINVNKRINLIIKKNAKLFKCILDKKAKLHKKKDAMSLVGGGPLALLLSTAIPLLLGQIIK
jgi:hypothetical protein